MGERERERGKGKEGRGEREAERERDREGKRERGKGRERGRERERERERDRERGKGEDGRLGGLGGDSQVFHRASLHKSAVPSLLLHTAPQALTRAPARTVAQDPQIPGAHIITRGSPPLPIRLYAS